MNDRVVNVWCPFCKGQQHVSHGRIGTHLLRSEGWGLDEGANRVPVITTVVCPGVGAMVTMVTRVDG